MRLRQFYVKNK